MRLMPVLLTAFAVAAGEALARSDAWRCRDTPPACAGVGAIPRCVSFRREMQLRTDGNAVSYWPPATLATDVFVRIVLQGFEAFTIGGRHFIIAANFWDGR